MCPRETPASLQFLPGGRRSPGSLSRSPLNACTFGGPDAWGERHRWTWGRLEDR